jgi:hypothetical protein
LKRLFAFLRTFKANAWRIFGKFEAFAKGFVDVEKLRFSAEKRGTGTGSTPPEAHINAMFTMTARCDDMAAAHMQRP